MENQLPEQRQYSLEEVLSITFNIIKKHWLKFVLICLIVYAPLLVIANLIDKSYLMNLIPKEFMDAFSSSFSAFGGGMNFKDMLNTLIPIYYYSFGIMLFGFIVTFTIAKIVESCAKAEEPSLQAAISASIKKYAIGLVTTIIFGIFMFFLSLPLFIPAIILAIYWTFFMNAIILRNRWGIDALRYSFNVVRGRWWRVLGYSIVFGLIGGFAAMVPSQIGQLFMKIPMLYGLFLLIGYILQSFSMIAGTVFFLNLESTSKYLVRKPMGSEEFSN
jgi:hypothetical protein